MYCKLLVSSFVKERNVLQTSPSTFYDSKNSRRKKQYPKREKIQLIDNAEGQQMHSAWTKFYEILGLRIKNVNVNFDKFKVAGSRKQGQIKNRAWKALIY